MHINVQRIIALSADTKLNGLEMVWIFYLLCIFMLPIAGCYLLVTGSSHRFYSIFVNDKNQINRILLAKLILLTNEIPKIVNKNTVFSIFDWVYGRAWTCMFVCVSAMPFISCCICCSFVIWFCIRLLNDIHRFDRIRFDSVEFGCNISNRMLD